ncbi:hypothetical protein DL766_006929 [Monosporascus sp. MC13-8B]|uniref:Uncharacterized protein n=1 Tax=Monosporascus cannonballus TaxID=155416 RepID=A0ABY0HF02_9PEZI|nr:hypothetical protein DL762_002993 [Monosporascus cannonballus]RYO96644.1 hypothetical protein DL763_003130 [Monosporascus cannonballus]RYP25745.1 hypothetical protein DL766_006929 [Monosporascus sp. MC13-8B]
MRACPGRIALAAATPRTGAAPLAPGGGLGLAEHFLGAGGPVPGRGAAQLLVMRETYAPAILTRKAVRLGATTRGTEGSGHWQSKLDSGLTG